MEVVSRDQEKRKRALQQLNAQLLAKQRARFSLEVSGSKIPLQTHSPGPSKIPRPTNTSKPLPVTGYVSERITLLGAEHSRPLCNPWQLQPVEVPVSPAQPSRDRRGERESPLRQTRVIKRGKTHPKQLVVTIQASSSCSQSGSGVGVVEQDGRRRRQAGRLGVLRPAAVKQKKEKQDSSERGRLEELRIRYIARKYWLLWSRCVYGRVSPSRARRYRSSAVKRRALSVWKEQWWLARREWKLSIRAECHNRYRLWQKVWSAWSVFVGMARERNRKKEQVQRFADGQRSRRVWRAWCVYVLVRRAEGAARMKAQQCSSFRLQRHVWRKWVAALEARRQCGEMDTLALHHWANTLQRKCYLSWVQSYTECVLRAHQTEAAVCHRSHKLLSRSLGAWLRYLEHRRTKLLLSFQARERHSRTLLRHCFCHWMQRYAMAKRLAEFEEAVCEMAALARRRRAFTRWKYYIQLQHHRTYQTKLAQLCHTTSLKVRVLGSLESYAAQRRLHRDNQRLAERCRAVCLLQQSWRLWLARCEDCEEMKLAPRSAIARQHFRGKLAARVVCSWRVYAAHRRHRKSLHCRADQLFREQALPRYFSMWRQFVQVQQYKCELKVEAMAFRRETLLSMLFYQWWRQSQLSQDLRTLERVAILHSEEVLKRALFVFWRGRSRERQRHSTDEELAIAHYRRKLVGGALGRWRSRWSQIRAGELQVRSARWHHANRLLTRVWSGWLRHVAQRRESHGRQRLADSHLHSTLQRRALGAWKVFHGQAVEASARNRAAMQLRSVWLGRRALRQWVWSVRQLRVWRERVEAAGRLWRNNTLTKCFRGWRAAASLSAQQRQSEAAREEEAKELLSLRRAARALASWRKHTHRRRVERAGARLAELHHAGSLRRKCFTAWQEKHRLSLRKMLLQRQCAWFHDARLLSACYSTWRVQLMNTLIMNQKSTRALWHWSCALERKLLVAWFLYMLDRRRKSSRFSCALVRYRGRLLAAGVSQWIKVATHMRAQREEMALQQQTKSVQSVYACVRRCASHWRRVARRRRQPGRQAPPLTDPGGVARHTGSSGEAVWSNLSRKLQLPEGLPPQRPAPRRLLSFLQSPPTITTLTPHPHTVTTLTTCPHTVTTLTTRPLKPSSPPVLYARRGNPLAAGSSFTFLPSSSSSSPSSTSDVAVSAANSSRHQPAHNATSPETYKPPLRNTTLCTRTDHLDVSTLPESSEAPSNQQQQLSRVALSGSTPPPPHPPLLLPPSVFERPAAAAAAAAAVVVVGGNDRPHTGLDLNDPALHAEMVQLRNALKSFHHLKTLHHTLKEQLSQCTDAGSHDKASELQHQLDCVARDISRQAPDIKIVTSRISQILAQLT